ncbi:MAG: hypothetical protein ACLT0X_00310 [Collinsella sp.]
MSSTYNVVVTDAEKSYLLHIVNLWRTWFWHNVPTHRYMVLSGASVLICGKGRSTARAKIQFSAVGGVREVDRSADDVSGCRILLIVGIIRPTRPSALVVLGSVRSSLRRCLHRCLSSTTSHSVLRGHPAPAKKNKGHASLIALMSFFLFRRLTTSCHATGSLADGAACSVLPEPARHVMGIQCSIPACWQHHSWLHHGAVFNKYSNKQFPLLMFSRSRSIMIIISWIWALASASFGLGSGAISRCRLIGVGQHRLFIYGMLNKRSFPPVAPPHLHPVPVLRCGGPTLGDRLSPAYPIIAEMQ